VGKVNHDLVGRGFRLNFSGFWLEDSMAKSLFFMIMLMLKRNFSFLLYLLQKLSQ
jgi:hypothetical protein